MARFLRKCASRILDDRGSVESALVIVPSMLLFLCVFQIALSVYQRNSLILQVQEIATNSAAEQFTDESTLNSEKNQISTKVVSLPSGRKLIVASSNVDHSVMSGSLNNLMTDIPIQVSGYAISENN